MLQQYVPAVCLTSQDLQQQSPAAHPSRQPVPPPTCQEQDPAIPDSPSLQLKPELALIRQLAVDYCPQQPVRPVRMYPEYLTGDFGPESAEFARGREAELIHGRWGLMGVIGFINPLLLQQCAGGTCRLHFFVFQVLLMEVVEEFCSGRIFKEPVEEEEWIPDWELIAKSWHKHDEARIEQLAALHEENFDLKNTIQDWEEWYFCQTHGCSEYLARKYTSRQHWYGELDDEEVWNEERCPEDHPWIWEREEGEVLWKRRQEGEDVWWEEDDGWWEVGEGGRWMWRRWDEVEDDPFPPLYGQCLAPGTFQLFVKMKECITIDVHGQELV